VAKKWIQKAHLKKGAFTASANKAGKSVHEFAEEHKHSSGKVGKRARLALTFQKMAKKSGGVAEGKKHHRRMDRRERG